MGPRRELVQRLPVKLPPRRDDLRRHALGDQAIGIAVGHRATVRILLAGGGEHRGPAHRFDPRRDHDVVTPCHHALGGERRRLLARTALAVDRRRRHCLGETSGQDRVAGDVERLLAGLRHAAADDILDLSRIKSVAVHEFAQHGGQEVDRVDTGERTAGLALPRSGPDRVYDHRVMCHESPALAEPRPGSAGAGTGMPGTLANIV